MARLNRLAPQPPAIRPTGEAYGVLKEQFGVTGSREGGSGALAEPVAVLRIKLPCRFRLVNPFSLPDLVGGSSQACAGLAELRGRGPLGVSPDPPVPWSELSESAGSGQALCLRSVP